MPLTRLPLDALDTMIEVSSTACVTVMQMVPEQRQCRDTDSGHTYDEIGALAAFLTKAANDARKRRHARG